MKRKTLEKLLRKAGWYLLRHGNDHDIWTNGTDIEPLPRHKEINERLAKYIIQKRGL